MIIIGAKGHAKEILQIFQATSLSDKLYFFDDVNKDTPDMLFGKFPILKSLEEAALILAKDSSFVSGIGGSKLRKNVVSKFLNIGGDYKTVISKTAQIGSFEVTIKEGCNIMSNVFISNSVYIGTGCLINQGASIHHDVTIGDYCEISPRATVLGRVTIGNNVSVGAGAIILPDTVIGDDAIIGAGCVVTKPVKKGAVVVGVPGKEKK